MSIHPTRLEVPLNGPWSRASQPLIPVSADDIVEAAGGRLASAADVRQALARPC